MLMCAIISCKSEVLRFLSTLLEYDKYNCEFHKSQSILKSYPMCVLRARVEVDASNTFSTSFSSWISVFLFRVLAERKVWIFTQFPVLNCWGRAKKKLWCLQCDASKNKKSKKSLSRLHTFCAIFFAAILIWLCRNLRLIKIVSRETI